VPEIHPLQVARPATGEAVYSWRTSQRDAPLFSLPCAASSEAFAMSSRYLVTDALEEVEHSLADFVRIFGREADDGNLRDSTAMALTGIDPDGRRIYLNPRRDMDANAHLLEDCRPVRDYDSIIGISTTLPYRHTMDVYPFPPKHLSLAADNHMRRMVVSAPRDGPKRPAPLTFSSAGRKETSAGPHP
jgi:hypothetical protein